MPLSRKSRTPRSASLNNAAPTPPRPTNGSSTSRTPIRSPGTALEAGAEPPRERTDWRNLEENDPTFDGFKIKMRKVGQPEPTPSKKRKRDEPVYSASADQASPFEPHLDAVYHVAPANYWEDTSRYRKFTVFDKTFEVNDFVFVRPSNEPGRENAPIPNWVAKVLEVRAGDEQHVYLRVYWMYRPEDLPGPGRRPYHAPNELIATNEMQIIDATTVQDSVQVKHYVEDDSMSEEIDGDELFWRQTYNVLHDSKTPGLSELPRHCIDKQPFNPGVRLVQCDSCTKWLHVPCIEDKVLQAIHKAKNLPYVKKQRGKRKSSMAAAGAIDPQPSFAAEVVFPNDKARVRITDLRNEETNERKTWEEDIKCLLCKKVIDADGQGNGEQAEEHSSEEKGEQNGSVTVVTKTEDIREVKPKIEQIENAVDSTDLSLRSPKKSKTRA